MKDKITIESKVHGFGLATRSRYNRGDVIHRAINATRFDAFHDRAAFIAGTMNHSCKPNVKLLLNDDVVSIVALDVIEPGEEIVCDYDQTEGTDGEARTCLCKTSTCKGTFHIRK